MNEPIIEVNDVSVMFRLYRERVDGIKEFVIKKMKNQISYDEFWALKDIRFHVGKGKQSGWSGETDP